MHLCYFDENKHTVANPHFFIGGLLIPDAKAIEFERTLAQIAFNFFGARTLSVQNEFHGKELFHGKGNAKGRKLAERVQVFSDIATFLTDNQIPVRMICIDVTSHQRRYKKPHATLSARTDADPGALLRIPGQGERPGLGIR